MPCGEWAYGSGHSVRLNCFAQGCAGVDARRRVLHALLAAYDARARSGWTTRAPGAVCRGGAGSLESAWRSVWDAVPLSQLAAQPPLLWPGDSPSGNGTALRNGPWSRSRSLRCSFPAMSSVSQPVPSLPTRRRSISFFCLAQRRRQSSVPLRAAGRRRAAPSCGHLLFLRALTSRAGVGSPSVATPT